MPSRDTLSSLLRGIAGLLGGARGDGVGRIQATAEAEAGRRSEPPVLN